MKHLSNDIASSIAKLAEASFRFDQASPATGEAVIEQILAPASEPRQALLDALDALSQPEAVELVALMYVGRGDLVEDRGNKLHARRAFQVHVNDFSSRNKDDLAFICAEKDSVLHEYLNNGLAHLA